MLLVRTSFTEAGITSYRVRHAIATINFYHFVLVAADAALAPASCPKQELHLTSDAAPAQRTKFPTRMNRGAPHDEELLCAIRAYQPKFNGFPVSMNVLKLLRVTGQLIRELS